MYTCIEGGVSVYCVLKVVLVYICIEGGVSVYVY